MLISMRWLKDYVDLEGINNKEFADKMTLSGSKVETVEVFGEEITNVVVGKILKIEQHPDADKLVVCQVDVGDRAEGAVQIVTGATNVFEGAVVPVALAGADLPGDVHIKKGKLRGVVSEGMMCSFEELGLTENDCPDAEKDGIYIFPEVTEDGIVPTPGMCAKEAMNIIDTVVDFEITPNRPDCLSTYGMALEAAVTFGKERKTMEPVVEAKADCSINDILRVSISAPDVCKRYMARGVKNVKIAPSPKWMRDRLRAAGVRPINNLVDITNYVMIELGQPLHAFDQRDIHGGSINVRMAGAGEKMMTLDDQERTLDENVLVIADADRAVAIAGVMGGQNSEIKDDTQTVIFESANFAGPSVRMTAKKIGLRTESSGRFEKGLDPENCELAVNRACELVEILGCGEVMKDTIDVYPNPVQEWSVEFNSDYINKFLGTDISLEYMVDTLKALHFVPNADKNEEITHFKVPTNRDDVRKIADLAEEVARMYDYNNIPGTLMESRIISEYRPKEYGKPVVRDTDKDKVTLPPIGALTPKQVMIQTLEETLISCGISEIYTYSFRSTRDWDLLNIPVDSDLRKAVVISNPLGEDYSIMRTETVSSMLPVLAKNYNRRILDARLYEIAKEYHPVDGAELPIEKEMLTIGVYGNDSDFFTIKGIAETIFAALRIEGVEYEAVTDNSMYHPGRTAAMTVNGEELGIIGQIHPDVADNFEGAKEVYVATISIAALEANMGGVVEYVPMPKYPSVNRDLALLVDEDVTVRTLEKIIEANAGKNLENVELFDVYTGSQVPEGKKSVAYALTFRANDRTLNEDDVNRAINKITKKLTEEVGAELRG